MCIKRKNWITGVLGLAFFGGMVPGLTQDVPSQSTSNKKAAETNSSNVHEGMKITFSGRMAFNAHTVHHSNKYSDKVLYNGGALSLKERTEEDRLAANHLMNVDSSRFIVRAQGQGNEWVKTYGLNFSFTVDAKKDIKNRVKNAYIDLTGDWGVVHLGNVNGAEDTMAAMTGASSVAGGTGGIDGLWSRVYPEATLGTQEISEVTPQGYTKEATKVAYYMPRLKEGPLQGTRIGFSYTPDTRNFGQAGLEKKSDGKLGSYGKNVLSAGIDWVTSLSMDTRIAWGLTSLWGQNVSRHKDIKYENSRNFIVGGTLIHKNWHYAVALNWKGKSGEIKNIADYKPKKSYNINGGIGYSLGSYVLTASALYGSRQVGLRQYPGAKARVTLMAFSVDRRIFPGLKAYVECTVGHFRNKYAQQEAEAVARKIRKDHAFQKNNRFASITVGTAVNF